VGVFALALLIALLAPLAQLWRASVTPLDAQACVWPRVPLVDQPAQIVVALPTGAEHSANQATRAIAEWDMANMRMGVRRASAGPSPTDSVDQRNLITIPLALDMAGVWIAHIKAQAPGRPDWASTLTFTALSTRQAGAAPTPTTLAGCAQPPMHADRSIGEAL
jgi:hypothetical protein